MQTLTERIILAANAGISDKAIEAVQNASVTNPLISQCVRDFASNKHFPKDYQKFINALNLANTLGVTVDPAFCNILKFCNYPDLLEDVVSGTHYGSSWKDLKYILDSVDSYTGTHGYSQDTAENIASDWIACRNFGLGPDIIPNHTLIADNNIFSAEEIHAIAEAAKRISDLADVKAEEAAPDSVHIDKKFADDIKHELFQLLQKEGCFDGNASPAQIKALVRSVCDVVEPMTAWKGLFTQAQKDRLGAVRDAIMSHRTYSAVYDNMINYGPRIIGNTAEEIWAKAKEMEVENKILKSFDAVMNDDPIPGLKKICEEMGYDEKTTEYVAEKATPLIDQNDFLKEHDAQNSDIRFIADMLIEGITPEDVFDILENSAEYGNNIEAKNALYECYHSDVPLDISIQCVKEGLNTAQRAEVIAGAKNGLSDAELMKLAVNKSPKELCINRMKLEAEHFRSIVQNAEEDVNNSVMADNPPQKEGVRGKVENLNRLTELSKGKDGPKEPDLSDGYYDRF